MSRFHLGLDALFELAPKSHPILSRAQSDPRVHLQVLAVLIHVLSNLVRTFRLDAEKHADEVNASAIAVSPEPN
jgi:hypothetical protein